MARTAFDQLLLDGSRIQQFFRDGWVNVLSGLGTARDKGRASTFHADAPLSVDELDALFNGDDLARTIVTRLVDDSLRGGFEVVRKSAKTKEDMQASQEDALRIQKRLEELKFLERLHDGAVWGRLFGGGALVLGVEGAGLPFTPLRRERTRAISFIDAADRGELRVRSLDKFGDPETYYYTPTPTYGASLGHSQVIVHASRLIMFPGVKTSKRAKARNEGWDHSVLQACYNALRMVNTQWDSVTTMFTDMSQAVFKLNGLIDAISEGRMDTMEKRIRFMDVVRSVARAIVLDNGNSAKGEAPEEYQVVERGALTGVDGILDKGFIRLSAAARMPATILLGQSPAGMDATGESDLEIWCDEKAGFRSQVLQPAAIQGVQLVCVEQGLDPDDWEIKWAPLRQPDAKAVAEIEKIRVDTVAVLVDKQVALPEEVAISLEKLAPELCLELDVKAREAALKPALEALKNPQPAVDPNADPNADPAADPAADPNAAKDPAEQQDPKSEPDNAPQPG